MGKIDRFRSKPAITGWIAIAILIWKILGEIDTLNSVVQNMSTVWDFLSTPVGMLVLLLVGLGLIAFSVLRREAKKVEDDTVKPKVLTQDETVSRLLDIAEKQRDNPITHLVITDRIWFEFKREAKLPFIHVRIYYKNLGVNDLLITFPEGYAYYTSERLPDRIEAQEGRHNVPANGGVGIFDLNIYIPIGFRDDVCMEIDNLPRREIRNLQLNEISSKVYIKGDDTRFVKWSLGGERAIFRPNG
ncbi:hypothetical protein ACFLUO_02070 [Chloroflexota bacterium]